MVEKRVSKTEEQIRAEAVAAARADMSVLKSHGDYCGCEACTALLGQQYRWHWERIEREATTWWSLGMPISAQQAAQFPGFTSWPYRGFVPPAPLPAVPASHVCDFDEGSSLPVCKVCGAIRASTPSIVTVGP